MNLAPIIIDETPPAQATANEPAQDPSDAEPEPTEESLARKMEETKNFAEFLDARQDKINKRRETLDEREKILLKREEEIETSLLQRQTQQADELSKNLQEIRTRETDRLRGELDEMRRKVEAELALRQDEIDERRETLDEREKILLKREEEIETSLLQRQTRLTDELSKNLQEIRARETDRLRGELDEMRQQQIDALNQELMNRRNALDEAEKKFADDKAAFEREQKNFEFDKRRLKKLEETLQNRQIAIDEEIQAGLDDRHKTLQAQLDAAKLQEKNLLDTLRQRENELATFQNFRAVYGDTPEILQRKMDDLRDRNAALVDELGKRPGEELQADYERLESECKRLKQERVDMSKQFDVMQEQVVELQDLRNENTILKTAKEHLKGLWDDAQETIDGLQARIDRLTATEITPADRDNRAASLREPYLKHPFNAPPTDAKDVAAVDEIDWLNRMEDCFNEYGITFPRRILYAFHTSFKIANWSTLTVLAGVSGTGKSELPRLYSAFGGFNFITVPVQPNWDSQESMLGFFNSIDNKFDAQPVLRFLVECTEKYYNNMAIVLLDEMNLAHVEHYFADFLSKLETRRSSPEDSVPEIEVNLGAGVKPYGLPLKRNILWCGTMNQDETTKSLSDKVLDRGIMINFPRPRELKSREGARSLEKFCDKKKTEISSMSVQLWNSWREKGIKLQGDQLKQLESYRHLLEKMNEHLSHAGRAIGHRVWQSIEHYVINYPTVRAAMKNVDADSAAATAAIRIAVEDQIVQKVMPKLRGIETRGKSYEKCLVPIRGLLNDNGFNLNDDFDRACESGYGQFMWSSAEYIGNDAERESGNDK